MKKLLIAMLSAICIVACLVGFTACDGNTYRGTYYGGYPNDASSDKLVISRSHASSGSTELTYTYSDNIITLSTGVQICFAEENQVAYFPITKWQPQGNIPTRNGYFSAQLIVLSNYQVTNTYQFNKDGTFRFVNVQSARITTGTYCLKNGVLSLVNKYETGSNGFLNLDKLHFWYIDQNYNIFSAVFVKDYTKFQYTDNDNSNTNGDNNENPPNDNDDNTNTPIYEPHTLTYNFNYDGASVITQQVTKNENVNLISPKRDGYNFLGWYIDFEQKTESGVWKYDKDVTLTAQWEEINYSITYNTDSGILPNDCLTSFTISYGLPYTLPIPAKQGFNFAGWYENADFSGEPITTIPKDSLQNYVLYAKYCDEQLVEFELSFDETYYSVVGYKGSPQYITVPETKDSLPVTEIAPKAFQSCYTLINIILPESICKIGSSAFYNCSNLTSITIPDSVTSIGDSAFRDCRSLTSITIPDSVTSIGNSAFRDCSNLISVTIPDSVTSIGDSAFYNCTSLKSVTLGNGVTSIGDYAFPANVYKRYSACDYLPTKNSEYGFLFQATATDITNVKIHNDCKTINNYAFSGCGNLTSITIPNSVTSIGDSAFYNCSNLTRVNYQGDITSWCNISFSNYSANPLYYAHSLYIDNELVTELVIPDTVTEIKDYAFYYCTSITSVTIPNSVTSIGDSAFYNCSNLTRVYYKGTSSQWNDIMIANNNYNLASSSRYYYSEIEPALNSSGTAYNGNYWHYDTDGKTPVIWKKEN